MSVSLTFHTFMYTRIFQEIRTRFRLENRPCDGLRESDAADIDSKRRATFFNDIKLAKSCFLVLLTFLVCCLPGVIVSALSAHLGILLFRVLQSWSVAIGLLNPSLNS